MSKPDQPGSLHDILCVEAMGRRSSEDRRTDRADDALTDMKAREGESPWLVH